MQTSFEMRQDAMKPKTRHNVDETHPCARASDTDDEQDDLWLPNEPVHEDVDRASGQGAASRPSSQVRTYACIVSTFSWKYGGPSRPVPGRLVSDQHML